MSIIYTVNMNNGTDIFESESKEAAIKFFEMCKRGIASEFNCEKMTAGKLFKRNYELNYGLIRFDSEAEMWNSYELLDYVSYDINDWERDYNN